MTFLINPYRFASAAVPWTPAQITTALWLDAGDSSTVTTVSGAVSQWNDKSGNSRNATQGTAGSRPTYTTAGQNGLNVLTFDGSDDVLIASMPTGLSGSFAVFAVVVPLRNQQIEGYVTSQVSSYGNYWFLLGRGGPLGQRMSLSLFDGAYNPTAEYSTLPTLGNGYIMNGIRDTTAGARNIFYHENGTLQSSIADNTTPPSYGELQIGAQTLPSGRYANVRIGEIVILSSLPSTTLRQQMEGYLAHRWGLTGNLPAGHPYKSAPPYV